MFKTLNELKLGNEIDMEDKVEAKNDSRSKGFEFVDVIEFQSNGDTNMDLLDKDVKTQLNMES